MGTHISGKAGSVASPTTVAGIKSWTLDYTVDTLETTDFADAGVRSYIVGCSGWSGSFEGFKDAAPQALTTGTSAVNVQLLESATSNQHWYGNAFITGVHASASFDGIVTYSYDFQGTGALHVASA